MKYIKFRYLLTFLTAFVFFCVCQAQLRPGTNRTQNQEKAKRASKDLVKGGIPAPLTIFYTGDCVGHLEPCG